MYFYMVHFFEIKIFGQNVPWLELNSVQLTLTWAVHTVTNNKHVQIQIPNACLYS